MKTEIKTLLENLKDQVKVVNHNILVLVNPDDDLLVKKRADGFVKDGDELKTQSGLFVRNVTLTDTVAEKRAMQKATVLMISDNAFDRAGDIVCQVGDDVFFSRYEGIKVPSELFDVGTDKEFLLLRDDMIELVFEGDKL